MDWAVGKKEYQGENVKQEQVEVKEEEAELDEVEAEVKQEAEEEVEPKEEPESEDDDSEDDDDEDENEDENVDERGDNTSQTRDGKWHSLKNGHDLGENLTVFVRNLSYDTEEGELGQAMVDAFGPIHFARLVLDR